MKKHATVIKRILAVALALLMALSLVACGGSSLADSAGGTHGSLSWDYDAETRKLTIGGSGEMADFASPDAIVWSAVLTSAQRIVIEEGVTSVGSYAFYYMPALTEVSLPSTVTKIGDFAFAYCAALTDLSLPAKLTSVGKSAFEACAALTSISLSASVTEVDERAFAYCSSLKSAVITGTLTELRAETFKNCTSLSALIFHESMAASKVSETAFVGASMDFSKATLTENRDGASVVTVRFVYEDNSEAAPAVTHTVPFGEEYKIDSPTIDGYTAGTAQTVGTADGRAHEHTVTYKVTEAQTEATPETEQPAEEEKEPITATTIIAIVVMALVLIGIAVGAVLLIRSDKKSQGGNKKAASGKQQNNKKGKK